MNIEQAVKQAIEEFGESAFERFRLFLSNCEEDAVNGVGYWFVFEDNDHMIMCPEFDDIQLKPLPELFNHDVKFYGADAYLMWEFHSVEWCDYESNDEVLNTTRRLRRKNSAKLPFDIERAKAGDVVEWKNIFDEWITFKKNVKYFEDSLSKNENRISVSITGQDSQWIRKDDLRHKYPKAAK